MSIKKVLRVFVLMAFIGTFPYTAVAEDAPQAQEAQPPTQAAPAAAAPAAEPAPSAPAATEPSAEELGDEEDDINYSYGAVKSVAADHLVLTEYDYEKDADVDVTYSVDSNVELENVSAMAEIKAGDSVEIDYVEKDGKKVAVLISVEKPLEEEPAAPAPAATEPAATPAGQ